MTSETNTSRFVVVGLGNPGHKYKDTRHNVGFWVIDALVEHIERGRISEWRLVRGPYEDHQGVIYQVSAPSSRTLYLLKPQTYMNLSGNSVSSFVRYHQIPLECLLVVHDEVDLPLGKLKMVFGRGHGGQNGVRDIHAKLQTPNYARLRIGIGRPAEGTGDLASWVLSPWTPVERSILDGILERAVHAIELWFQEGYTKAVNLVNREET